MALFPWKKSGDGDKGGSGSGGGSGGGGDSGGFEFSPEKARRFFDRAQTLHDATNFAYAMQLWLQGLRFEPNNMGAIKGFFDSAGAFMNSKEGAKGPSKDTYKEFSGRSDLDKYLYSLLDWSGHPTEASYAVKAVERASELGLAEPAAWLGERALGAALRDKKPRKEYFVAIMNALAKAERYDLAVQAGQQAVNLDPTDARLAADVKNMSAESTMRRGGFDQAGQEGGFRANIRDAAKQKALEEGDRTVKTEEVLDRQIAGARADYETSPLDKPIALRLVDLLIQRDNPDDQQAALVVLDEMYRKTQEYRFRERADQLRLRQMRARLREVKAAAEAPSAGEAEKDTYKQAFKELMVAQIRAGQLAVQNYPTDLVRKFELGKLLFEVRKYEDAIALFQEAQNDPKNRAEVLQYLGLSFQLMGGFNDEAIGTLRSAISMHQDGDDSRGMSLKYALMDALFARAKEQTALADAEEAYKIASAITIKQINYRDVRAKREEIKAFIAQHKPGAGGGAAGAA